MIEPPYHGAFKMTRREGAAKIERNSATKQLVPFSTRHWLLGRLMCPDVPAKKLGSGGRSHAGSLPQTKVIRRHKLSLAK